MPDCIGYGSVESDAFDIYLKARRRLPRMMFDFIDGATGCEVASTDSRLAFHRVKLLSRVLRNVETLSTSTELLDESYRFPFGIAPMGMCNLISPEGDSALSEAARGRGIPHCVSTASSTTLEKHFTQADGRAWFQLYAGTNEALTFEMVDRAQKAGYRNLVFTADTPRHSRRTRDLDNGFSVPLKIGLKQFLDFALHPKWSINMLAAGAPKPMNFETSKLQNVFVRDDSRGGSDWVFLDKLRKYWKGNLIVKGVMSVEDALRIRDAGCDAIYVSNHGGRQLDSALAAIEALPMIRDALGTDTPIIFDSGVRSADDIVRSLALGADFVMLGRPLLYALGAGGGLTLKTFFDLLESDLKSVMAQIGVTSIEQINRSVLAEDNGPAS